LAKMAVRAAKKAESRAKMIQGAMVLF